MKNSILGLTLNHKKITYFLIAIALCGALVNVDYFGNPTIAAFFFYIIPATLLAAVTGIFLLNDKKQVQSINYFPVLFFFLLVLFYFLQNILLSPNALSTVHVYMAVNFLFFAALLTLFKTETVSVHHVFKIIFLFASFESFLCILQSLGLIKSMNEYLPVSGSWINPNVTAMFLALSVPAAIGIVIQSKAGYKKLYAFAGLMILTALVLLKCRTALLGGSFATIVVLSQYYKLPLILKTRLSQTKRVFFLVILPSALIIPACIYAYKAKQASADGRQLVWKISSEMVAQNPFIGIGYGMFDRDYNLQQANYFATHNATAGEINNASFVHMAYNEYLQNAVEGGIVGFILFAGLLLSLALPLRNDSNKKFPLEIITARSGVAAFAVMSVVNFTVEAIPGMAVFIIYAAVICTGTTSPIFKKMTPLWFKPAMSGLLIIAGTAIFFSQMFSASAYIKTNQAARLLNENDNAAAIEILEPLQEKMKTTDFYWNVYGKALYNQKRYNEALLKFNQSAKYSSNPSLLIQISNCMFKLKQTDSAVAALQLVSNMIPNRLTPKYHLMKIYQQTNDTANACRMATILVSMKPKGISLKADDYKQEAQKLLTVYNNRTTTGE